MAIAIVSGMLTTAWAGEEVPRKVVFQRTVHLVKLQDSGPWRSPVNIPGVPERLFVALKPLWAVEGGIVAVEVVLSRTKDLGNNLLGERGGKPESVDPFVLTVDDLTRLGVHPESEPIVRVLPLPPPYRGAIRVRVPAVTLGYGAGTCSDCFNIQNLDAEVRIER